MIFQFIGPITQASLISTDKTCPDSTVLQITAMSPTSSFRNDSAQNDLMLPNMPGSLRNKSSLIDTLT